MDIDAQRYRETLGQYPTGVVLITAIEPGGQPLGLVIGSFTSLSLEPPQVVFMPMRASRTFARIREAGSFCVNVLAADQLDVCRVFASNAVDKFADVAWRPAPVSGAPILEGSVSWLDCTIAATIDGGDHYIVVGDIHELDVQRQALPLLFFQGGYGRFETASLVAPTTPELIAALRVVDQLREQMEHLAESQHAEVSVIAQTGDWLTCLALANGRAEPATITVGIRFPFLPPLGSVFVDGDHSVERWLDALPRGFDGARERARELVDKVADTGYSLSLLGSDSDQEIWRLATELSDDSVTPSREREIKKLLLTDLDSYEPTLVEDLTYDVRAIITRIPTEDPGTHLGLRFAYPPAGATEQTVRAWIADIMACASSHLQP